MIIMCPCIILCSCAFLHFITYTYKSIACIIVNRTFLYSSIWSFNCILAIVIGPNFGSRLVLIVKRLVDGKAFWNDEDIVKWFVFVFFSSKENTTPEWRAANDENKWYLVLHYNIEHSLCASHKIIMSKHTESKQFYPGSRLLSVKRSLTSGASWSICPYA